MLYNSGVDDENDVVIEENFFQLLFVWWLWHSLRSRVGGWFCTRSLPHIQTLTQTHEQEERERKRQGGLRAVPRIRSRPCPFFSFSFSLFCPLFIVFSNSWRRIWKMVTNRGGGGGGTWGRDKSPFFSHTWCTALDDNTENKKENNTLKPRRVRTSKASTSNGLAFAVAVCVASSPPPPLPISAAVAAAYTGI